MAKDSGSPGGGPGSPGIAEVEAIFDKTAAALRRGEPMTVGGLWRDAQKRGEDALNRASQHLGIF